MRKEIRRLAKIWLCIGLVIALRICYQAQGGGAKLVIDSNRAKSLPGKWVVGQASCVCVDAQDHLFRGAMESQ
jgi:hypothetical protein